MSDYRRRIAIVSLGALLTAVAAAARAATESAWLLLVPLVQTLGLIASFAAARRAVQAFGLLPSDIRQARLVSRVAKLPGGFVGQALPFSILLVAAGYLALHWAGLPSTFPIHWRGSMTPDAWAERSPRNVFALLAVGFVLCATMALVSRGILRSRAVYTAGPRSAAESKRRLAAAKSLLSFEYLVAVVFAALGVSPSIASPALSAAFPIVILTAVPLGGLALGLWATLRMSTALDLEKQASDPEDTPSPTGDRMFDSRWKLGFFYCNREDPVLFVEMRTGLGYTMNFARPAGVVAIVRFYRASSPVGLAPVKAPRATRPSGSLGALGTFGPAFRRFRDRSTSPPGRGARRYCAW